VNTIANIAVLITAISVANPTLAQVNREEVRSSCKSDYHRFCSGVLPGGGRIIACLNQHVPELDPACAKAVVVAGKCIEDRNRLCPDVPTGKGELLACLTRHKQQLNPACAAVLRNKENR
jgi:hypothetical protein